MMKVLYAEDELQMSAAVCEILKMEGFEVTAVYDGLEAWDKLESEYFDAVILDVMMPGLDGLEVLAKMREAGIHTSVLMLTAKAALDDRITGLAQGADDYLCKPFAVKELVARVRALDRRNSDYRHECVRMGNVELDEATGEIKTEAGSLRISHDEVVLLAHFMKNARRSFSLDEVNAEVWKGAESPEKAELYIFYLKNKLRQIHADIVFEETSAGFFSLGGKS